MKNKTRRHKTRKASIQLKILLPTSLLLIIVCMGLGSILYYRAQDGLVSMGVEEAEMASKIAVGAVDGDALKDIVPGSENSGTYQNILSDLRKVQETCGIKYLYTLYTDGKEVFYGVDTDSSDLQAKVGQVHESSYDELKDVFAGKEYIQGHIEENEYGNLISVFQPITNGAGEVVGVLGSDYDATSVLEKLSDIAKINITISLLCQVVAIVLLFVITRTIMRSLYKVDDKIYELVNNEGDLTQKLDVTSGDEMETDCWECE